MLTVANDFNPILKELKESIKKNDIENVKIKFLELHETIHSPLITKKNNTFEKQILANLSKDEATQITTDKYNNKRTIAFLIYHTSRIEDMCSNRLIAGNDEIFYKLKYKNKLNIELTDTGNAWTEDEMKKFNENVNLDMLFEYRKEVALKTREVISKLQQKDLKSRLSTSELNKLIETSSVLERKESYFLLDYWNSKSKSELILMPLLRHHILHLNDCLKLRKKWSRK